MPGALDHLDPGARNPLSRVRRGGERHRAPRAVDEADRDANLGSPAASAGSSAMIEGTISPERALASRSSGIGGALSGSAK